MEGSRYNIAKNRLNSYDNLGYDYKDKIMLRNTNSEIYGNPIMKKFGAIIESVVSLWFKSTKALRTMSNPAVEKDTTYIN